MSNDPKSDPDTPPVIARAQAIIADTRYEDVSMVEIVQDLALRLATAEATIDRLTHGPGAVQ